MVNLVLSPTELGEVVKSFRDLNGVSSKDFISNLPSTSLNALGLFEKGKPVSDLVFKELVGRFTSLFGKDIKLRQNEENSEEWFMTVDPEIVAYAKLNWGKVTGNKVSSILDHYNLTNAFVVKKMGLFGNQDLRKGISFKNRGWRFAKAVGIDPRILTNERSYSNSVASFDRYVAKFDNKTYTGLHKKSVDSEEVEKAEEAEEKKEIKVEEKKETVVEKSEVKEVNNKKDLMGDKVVYLKKVKYEFTEDNMVQTVYGNKIENTDKKGTDFLVNYKGCYLPFKYSLLVDDTPRLLLIEIDNLLFMGYCIYDSETESLSLKIAKDEAITNFSCNEYNIKVIARCIS